MEYFKGLEKPRTPFFEEKWGQNSQMLFMKMVFIIWTFHDEMEKP